MNLRCLARALLLAALLPCLPAAATPTLPLRVSLHVVEGCPLQRTEPRRPCPVAHQRSDAAAPPPQVQALTPPPAGGGTPVERPWLTITF